MQSGDGPNYFEGAVDLGGFDENDPGVREFLLELARIRAEAETAQGQEDLGENIAEMEAKWAQLQTSVPWLSGIRVRLIERRNGTVEELLTYDVGGEVRAMRVRDDSPQTSDHRHPKKGGGGPRVHPDSLASELLEDLPPDERTGDRLLEIARQNAAAYERYRVLEYIIGKLTVAEGNEES